MFIGYARVSTDSQETEIQELALKQAGCEKIFTEIASGAKRDRTQLIRTFDQLRSGDVLVVWKLDRLSRSLKDLLTLMEKVEHIGCGFKSLTESIDTTTPAGRMMMQMVGSFSEFERAMIRERTMAGIALARQQGRIGGRRYKLDLIQRQEIIKMVESGEKTAADASRLFNVHPSTVSRLLASSQKL
jgi:DNA invertase Pin-like site-specific DNA recombinase